MREVAANGWCAAPKVVPSIVPVTEGSGGASGTGVCAAARVANNATVANRNVSGRI